MNSSLFSVYKKIWRHIPKTRRIQLLALILLMLLTSIFEIVSIGSVIPFIGILTSPEKLIGIDFLYRVIPIDWHSLDRSSTQLLITIFFSLAVFTAGLLRIFLVFCQIRISHYLGVEFGVKVFSSILFLDYQEHTKTHTSEMILAVSKAQELIPYLLQPSLVIISSSMIALSIFFTLLYVNYFVTLVTVIAFVTIYFLLIQGFRKSLIINSENSSRERVKSLKVITEGLGGIRDIILDRSHNYFIKIFQESSFKVQTSNSIMQILSSTPRFILETFGMIIIAFLAFMFVNDGTNLIDVIPVFGVLALGAQKLLPLLQQIYAAFASILGNKSSVAEAVNRFDGALAPDDDTPSSCMKTNHKTIPFLHNIEMRDIGFRFSKTTPWVLSKFNLFIKKGARIGIIGETGCGKSTALDILMALLKPEEGALLVDGLPITEENQQAWQAMISHVPQSIFLSDASVRENIAFGVNQVEIDDQRVIRCAQIAKISETIEHMEKGYLTEIGERGVRLSGGQRQRLGIARALYKKSSVIVFDEATSALDSATEQKVMDSIYATDENVTIIMVAHRLSTLDSCDFIYKVHNGNIELIKDNSSGI